MAQGTVYVVSNFTADPLSTGLTFWFDSLQLPWTVEFAPYDQIFQQLLDPGSGLRQNRGGANVLLVRLDRLARADASRQSGTILDELITALRDAVTATAQPMLVVCCPATQPGERDAATANAHMEEQLASAFAGSGQVTVLRSRDVLAPLGNAPWHDPETEALGDIPYTELFFVSLATAIARHVRLLIAPPHKVIALDCDNTLWRGVVGELGSDGVEIDNAARRLQEFLVTQQEAGMLLVLCSKNNFADVEEVFRTRSDTPLKWEHIVRSRINWEPKSVNLRALASELNLGLDSFVFIDDSAYEIAEVRQNAPEVLALHLPSADKDVERFLRASWWSDRLTVTDADRRRGATYREQLERSDAIQQSGSLEDFLRGLQLVVDVLPPRAAALARAAQMTLRTNQFNLSTIRRTEQELAALLASGALEARIINVRDRFGDYGTVGLLLFSVEGKRLVADTFLLSCRALSRRVEHRMLAMLGQVARERGAERIELPYVKSKKNAPILAFLNLLGVEENAIEADHRFVVSVEQALAAPELPFDASIAADGDDAGDAAPVAATGSSMNDALAKICSEWATPADLLPAIRAYVRRMAPAAPARTLVPPRTDTERDLVAAFQRALHTEDVGITDNFFDLGGDSVGAVALFAQLRRRYDRSLVPTLLLEAGAVEQLAARLGTARRHGHGAVLLSVGEGARKRSAAVRVPGSGTVRKGDGARVDSGDGRALYPGDAHGSAGRTISARRFLSRCDDRVRDGDAADGRRRGGRAARVV